MTVAEIQQKTEARMARIDFCSKSTSVYVRWAWVAVSARRDKDARTQRAALLVLLRPF